MERMRRLRAVRRVLVAVVEGVRGRTESRRRVGEEGVLVDVSLGGCAVILGPSGLSGSIVVVDVVVAWLFCFPGV